MNPPEGRIVVGAQVELPGGRRGRVVAERLIASNGAWVYTVALDEGGTDNVTIIVGRTLRPGSG